MGNNGWPIIYGDGDLTITILTAKFATGGGGGFDI